MSIFQCFSPFTRRRRSDALTPRDRRRLRRSLRSKAASPHTTISLPFTDGPISSGALSERSWVHSTAIATTDTVCEPGRSPHRAHPTCANTASMASSAVEPPDALHPRLSAKAASSRTSTTSPPGSPASSGGGSTSLRAQLRTPAPCSFSGYPPPPYPTLPVDRGNPRLPYPITHPRSNSAGSTPTLMERTGQASLSLQSITDDSTKTARFAPAAPPDHGPVTANLHPIPVGPPSSFSSQHGGGAIFSPVSSLCESPTHHASFQSWLQTGSARSTGSPPASARIRALSLAAETNLSSDFSVHLYVDPPRSARSTAVLAACSNAAYNKAAHVQRARSNQVVDYFGILPTTVEEEVDTDDTVSIPDAAAETSLRMSPDALSIALDTAGGHSTAGVQGAAAAAAAGRPSNMTQMSSLLADVSADVIVDVCATETTAEISHDFGSGDVRVDVMSTMGTVRGTPTVEGSRLAAASFPGTVSSLHSTASGSLLGMVAASMPAPDGRGHYMRDTRDVNASAPLWEDPAAEAGAVLALDFPGGLADARDAPSHDTAGVPDGRCAAIADSAGIPLPSASIAVYSSGEFAAVLSGHSARLSEEGAAERADAAPVSAVATAWGESVPWQVPATGPPSDRRPRSTPADGGDARCTSASTSASASASPPASPARRPHPADDAAAARPPLSPSLAYSQSELFLPAGLKPYRVSPRKRTAPTRASPMLRPTYSVNSIPTTPPAASLGSDEFSGSISCPPSRVPSAPASRAESGAPASSDSASSLPQPYSIVSSAVPISSDASTILPASTIAPTSLASTMHPASIESSLAPTSLAPGSTCAPSSSLAPTSIASTNPRTSIDKPGSLGRPNLLRLPSSGGSTGAAVTPPLALAAAHQRYVALASKRSPRLRHYPECRPARLRPSPRLLKSRNHSATLSLFPSSGGSMPRPITPNMSPRNFTSDIDLKPHDMQPSTNSTQHSSGVPSLDAILDCVAPAPPPAAGAGVIELSTAAELSTVDELSTVPDMLEFADDDDGGAVAGELETTGDLETSGMLGGTAELETTSELDAESHMPEEVERAPQVEEEEGREEDDDEGSDDVLGLPGLPSSMSSVHSAALSPSLQRQKRLVDKLMTTGSSYGTAESCTWATPRARSSRSRSHSSSSGASAPLLRSFAGPAQRHVFRGNRIDVRALLAANPCAAAAAAAADAQPGTLAPPESAVLAAHERILSHVPLAHEAQPRGAHFGVLPARRPPPDSVGSTLSTASLMLPASRGPDAPAPAAARGSPPPSVNAADTVTAAHRPGWR